MRAKFSCVKGVKGGISAGKPRFSDNASDYQKNSKNALKTYAL